MTEGEDVAIVSSLMVDVCGVELAVHFDFDPDLCRLAIGVAADDDAEIQAITVDLVGCDVEQDEVVLVRELVEGAVDALIGAGIVVPTGRTIDVFGLECPIAVLGPKGITEADRQGAWHPHRGSARIH